jgi:radical SAM superfamily enzyme YgiQ (UPF0313 family)
MQPPVAPIGLEYIAAALRRRGYEPVLRDLAFSEGWKLALAAAVTVVKPAAILVTIRNIDDAYFASQDFVLETTAQMVRHIKELSDTPVILGGVGFSIAPREVLRFTGADYGIVGEGEEALPALLDCLGAAGDIAKVPGDVFRAPDGRIAVVPPVPCNIEELPTPSRRFLDNPRYFEEGGQAGVETKRGCTGLCIYCVEPNAKGNRIRLRNPKSVAEEFADLLDQGIDAVHLCDSEFNMPRHHAYAVCEALAESGVASKMHWHTYASPHRFDKGLAQAMAKAGCRGIDFGVDHADPAMLQRLARKYGQDDIRQTAEACRAAGIPFMFDLLLGGPGETPESLERAIDFMREVKPDRVGLSCGVRVYPHTPLAGMVLEQGPLASNPNLYGATENNDDLLRPIFYVDSGIGGDIHRTVGALVKGDKRFLHADPDQVDGNYNYNDNSVLSNAIRDGERGAYWAILLRRDQGAA